MPLPFLQVDSEMIENAAPEIAVELDADEMAILGGLVRLVRWALGRVPEGALPSQHAIVAGPNAAKLIARAARYNGDPEAFAAACSRCSHPILEPVEGGIRIRGLGRYDEAVISAGVRSQVAKAAAKARWNAPSSAHAMPDACIEHPPSNAGPMLLDANTQTQTQMNTQKAAAAGGVVLTPTEIEHRNFQAEKWGATFGRLQTPVSDRDFAEWYRPAIAALARLGQGDHELRLAYLAFLSDEFWARKSRRKCPWPGWVSQWRDFLPASPAAKPKHRVLTIRPYPKPDPTPEGPSNA